MFLEIGSMSEKSQYGSSLNFDRLVKRNGKKSCKKSNEKEDLQKEILGALFKAPERVEELPKKTSFRRYNTSTLYRNHTSGLVKETNIEEIFVAVKTLAGDSGDKEEENSFPLLRQAVKENRATMNEYYKSATNAFIQDDRSRSLKLMKEGDLYNNKAREADEESSQMIVESREDEILLDISTFELKEAIKLLKLHLSRFAGIQAFRFLKVTVGDGVGKSKGRLKRLVLKLLERELIQWTEEDNGKKIVVQLDEISPKALTFTKKKGS